jgi:hypothetical protein
MLKELDRIVLTAPLASEGLERGDVGTIVMVHGSGEAFEVEFMTLDGETAAVATVESDHVRPVGPREIVHARQLAAR